MEQNQLRNFVIIAHIDHGKSTLADRFLELTGTVAKEKMRPQFLDMMDLERERGITIKMQPVRMVYSLNFKSYILNLIDTPGHVDFSYEVSRSLAAVEGAILLVDAVKGVQAQTLANLELAQKQNLTIIPAINKIDSPQARIEDAKKELAVLLNISESEIFEISAKRGDNVEKLLEAIIEKIPPSSRSPGLVEEKPLRALIFDSKYDTFKGVIAFVRVFDGKIGRAEKIYLLANKIEGEAKEVGYFTPKLISQNEIGAGEIGYIATGIKEIGKVRVGDTITNLNLKSKILNLEIEPLPGYKESKPMVFAGLYPENPDDFDLLKDSLLKLKLNDASLVFEPESKEGLGRGFRCGFLGNLHAEIVSERLRREYRLNLIISSPSVGFKIMDKNNRELFVKSAADWLEDSQIKEIKEPFVKLEIISPQNYASKVIELIKSQEGNYIETKYLSQDKMVLIYEIPLRAVVEGFYDKLKGISQGYASMNYYLLDFRPSDLVKMEVLVAGKKEEPFSKIVPRARVQEEGRKTVKKLKEVLPQQLFSVALQAAVSGKIIARETIRAKSKDVTGYLYGGDYTRKKKLLEKQKRGKKLLKEKGEVRIPPKVFLEVFKAE